MKAVDVWGRFSVIFVIKKVEFIIFVAVILLATIVVLYEFQRLWRLYCRVFDFDDLIMFLYSCCSEDLLWMSVGLLRQLR